VIVDVSALLRQAEDSRLWGNIQLDFQDGRIILIRRSETLKPTSEGTTHAQPAATSSR
jgi:hypothetical protein